MHHCPGCFSIHHVWESSCTQCHELLGMWVCTKQTFVGCLEIVVISVNFTPVT